jgi:site-specific DNA-methyltransferase (adenine-specific)
MSKDMLVKYHEDILIFSPASIAHNSKNKMKYTPVGAIIINKSIIYDYGGTSDGSHHAGRKHKKIKGVQRFTKYPGTVIKIESNRNTVHPTQKPVALYKYLVQTYTNPGDTVLDMCMGSGTTGVACVELGRDFIGCEKEEEHFQTAEKRIEQASLQGQLFTPPKPKEEFRQMDLEAMI